MDDRGEPCLSIGVSTNTGTGIHLMQQINPEYTGTGITGRMSDITAVSVTAKVKSNAGSVRMYTAVFNTDSMHDAQSAEHMYYEHIEEPALIENTDAPAIIKLVDRIDLFSPDDASNPYYWFRLGIYGMGPADVLYLYWIKMEFGSPTPYISPDSAAELAKCKRYQDRTVEVLRPYHIDSNGMSAIMHWDPPISYINNGMYGVTCQVNKNVGATKTEIFGETYGTVDMMEQEYTSPAGTVKLNIGLLNNHGLTYENAEIVVLKKEVYDY
jgi:hypothetical protein